MKKLPSGLVIGIICSSVLDAYQLGIDYVTVHDVQKVAHSSAPRIGLLTNQTGRDMHGHATVDVLRRRGILVQRLFVPEHGLQGTIPASAGIKTIKDKRTGLEVVGLMKRNGELAVIDPAKLNDIDMLMVDLQDIGMRHFTYSGFMFYCMEVAAQYKKPCIVLDRPNLLGAVVEGPVVKRVEKSLIARASLPVRHGLTMGELARFYNATCLSHKVDLHVIPLKNYQRTDVIDETEVVQLSPNVQHKQAVYGYSFLGALGEIRPFDVGIGTEHAMQVCALSLEEMSHKTFWLRLAETLKNLGMDTVLCSYWSPRKNTWCRGLRFVASNEPPQQSFAVLLAIVDAARHAGIKLSFAPFFDRAVGDPLVQRYFQGKVSRQELAKTINKQLIRYQEKSKPLLLYQPEPIIRELK